MKNRRIAGSSNIDIMCLFLFIVLFACVMFYDELSEMINPIMHDIICGNELQLRNHHTRR